MTDRSINADLRRQPEPDSSARQHDQTFSGEHVCVATTAIWARASAVQAPTGIEGSRLAQPLFSALASVVATGRHAGQEDAECSSLTMI